MEILTKRERVETLRFGRNFVYRGDETGAGFTFDCDKEGKVDVDALNSLARENYEKCLSGEYDVEDHGVLTFRNAYNEPATGRCSCGEVVILDGFTNTCDGCNADYNMSGSRLAPRIQWGEETGETAADILGPQPRDY